MSFTFYKPLEVSHLASLKFSFAFRFFILVHRTMLEKKLVSRNVIAHSRKVEMKTHLPMTNSIVHEKAGMTVKVVDV